MYHNNKPVTMVFTGDSGSNLEIFPEDIEMLLDEKYGKNAILNTWAHCAQIKARRDNGMIVLTITWNGYQLEIHVPDEIPIFIGVRKTYAKIGIVTLPRHLNDQVAWALGLRNFQQKELPKDWKLLHAGAMTLAYDYSSIIANYPDMFCLVFNGSITRIDAIRALETCLDNRLYRRNNSSRIRYLLSILKK